jgi:serine protease Do
MNTIRRVMRGNKALLVVCALSIALGFSLALNLYNGGSPVIAAESKIAVDPEFRDLFVKIADKLEPSVVFITSEKVVESSGMGGGDFFFGPFGPPGGSRGGKQLTTATGSGFVVRSDGYIMTNNHVVGGADRVTVKLADGREFKGKVLLDPRTDLALVKIDAKDLPAVEFADSEKIKVGQWAVAIGNPFGFNNTVTVGVVSGLQREFAVPDGNDPKGGTFYPDAIQTDASINPGNSGGPLVDIDGRVVGINSAIYSRTGGSMGIGFAVPSNTAKYVMDQLIEKGKVVRGYLGLMPSDLTPVLRDKLGVREGALVESVDKDSPAESGGLQVKDVVVKIQGKPIANALGLRRVVQMIKPGNTVDIVIVRDKKEQTLQVKVGEAPGSDESSDTVDRDKVGMSVQPLDSDTAQQLGIDERVKGVVVTKVEPGSAADRAGIEPKDVITELDDSPVTSVASFSKAVKSLKSGQTAVVVVVRGNHSEIVEMPID